MKSSRKNDEVDYCELTPYQAIGDRCGLSGRTIRTAFARKPITYQTACRIAKALQIPVAAFRIKEDMRGRNRQLRPPTSPRPPVPPVPPKRAKPPGK